MEAKRNGQSGLSGLLFQSWSSSRRLQQPHRQQQRLQCQCQQGPVQGRQVSCIFRRTTKWLLHLLGSPSSRVSQ